MDDGVGITKKKENHDLCKSITCCICCSCCYILCNIVLFIAFIIWYIIKSSGKPDRYEDKCIFSLRGETYVGQVLIIIKNFLNIKV